MGTATGTLVKAALQSNTKILTICRKLRTVIVMPKKSSRIKKRPVTRKKWALWLLGIAIILLAFSFLYPKSASAPVTNIDSSLIGTYSGILPCADCSGINATLTLGPDGTYSQTYVYQGKNTNFTEKGTYVLSLGIPQDTRATLVSLTPTSGQAQYLSATNSSTLQMLDADKNAIEGAPLPMILTRK